MTRHALLRGLTAVRKYLRFQSTPAHVSIIGWGHTGTRVWSAGKTAATHSRPLPVFLLGLPAVAKTRAFEGQPKRLMTEAAGYGNHLQSSTSGNQYSRGFLQLAP